TTTLVIVDRRREKRDERGAAGFELGQDFSGRWKLAKSVNFDEYLESLNVSSTHRKFATRATVEHRIRRWPDGDNTKYEVCVVNRLGKKCELFTVGARPIESSDARGDPITKRTEWEGPDKKVLVTSVNSTAGALVDRRILTSEDEMVMELISPTRVRAFRIFSRVQEEKEPAAGKQLTAFVRHRRWWRGTPSPLVEAGYYHQ
ncbi:hypothetical protein CTAYLR_009905, partial [Chrysophaeum taylorii]